MGAVKCGGEPPVAPQARAKGATDAADQMMFGVRGVLTHGSVSRGILLADTAYVSNDGTRYELRDVSISFFDTAGVKTSELVAPIGIYDLRGARVEVNGTVVIAGRDGRRLQTGRVAYDIARNLLVGNAPYTLNETNPSRQRSGTAFESDPQLMRVRVPQKPGAAPAQPTRPRRP